MLLKSNWNCESFEVFWVMLFETGRLGVFKDKVRRVSTLEEWQPDTETRVHSEWFWKGAKGRERECERVVERGWQKLI